uniref:Major facilitator superfamily (MFS) profile domain-containing protein n=1 Tax=Strigamia maritima TaxID=126957 RepID=T1IXG1_STRMM
MVDTFDDCLLELGNPGRFRLLLYGLLLLNMCMVGPNFFLTLYTGYVPKHHCRLSPNSTFFLNESIPLIKVHGHYELDKCHLWVDPKNTTLGTTECLYGWEYEVEDGEWFVSTEFDLVCHQRYILSLGLSMQYTGIMIGGIIFGMLSDNIGRRKSCILAMLGHSLFSIALAFTRSAVAYFSCAFMLGLFIQGLHSCSYTMCTELFHPRQRTMIGVIIGLPWSLCIPIVAGIFWAVRSWNYVQLILGILSLVGVAYVYIPESLRWHIARGNIEQMWEISQRFARFNKMKLRPTLYDDYVKISAKMVNVEKSSALKLLKQLFTSPRLRKYTIIMGITYFTSNAIYFALGLAIPKLGDDGSINYLPVSIAILGNACLTMSFGGLGLYISELFPTLLRSVGLGFCVTLGRIGSMSSPQILLLDMIWELLPITCLTTLGITSAVLILLLPETNNKPLPDSVADANKLDRTNTNKTS